MHCYIPINMDCFNYYLILLLSLNLRCHCCYSTNQQYSLLPSEWNEQEDCLEQNYPHHGIEMMSDTCGHLCIIKSVCYLWSVICSSHLWQWIQWQKQQKFSKIQGTYKIALLHHVWKLSNWDSDIQLKIKSI